MECMETGRFCSWKQCKQVSCGVPPQVISVDIQVCSDCEVHYKGSLPYACIASFTLDASPNGSNAFTAKCESTGLFSVVENCIAIVCGTPPQSWKNGTLVDPCVEKRDEINECVEWYGHGSCSVATCNNQVNDFSCFYPIGQKYGAGDGKIAKWKCAGRHP